MEDVEKAILIKIPILKAKLKNFSADVDEECIEKIAESELEDFKNVVLEIAVDIGGLLREYRGEHPVNTMQGCQLKERSGGKLRGKVLLMNSKLIRD